MGIDPLSISEPVTYFQTDTGEMFTRNAAGEWERWEVVEDDDTR